MSGNRAALRRATPCYQISEEFAKPRRKLQAIASRHLRDNGTMHSCPRLLGVTSLILTIIAPLSTGLHAQTDSTAGANAAPAQQQIIIDTDIGDDIDDAFAIALALQSPELHILGFTTTFGDTAARARLLRRLLVNTGHPELAVAAGPATPSKLRMSQLRYAQQGPPPSPAAPDAVTFLSEQIRAHPGQITLVAIGPLTTVEAMLDTQPALFRQLRQVVVMGGSVDRGYGPSVTDPADGPPHGPDVEWNIVNDIGGARKLLASGVPVIVMPLDATQLPLDEVKRALLFAHGSSLTDALTLLYHQWGQQTPTLFDAMTVAYLLQPHICPVGPIRLQVDDKGYTRREAGAPNAQVCLHSDHDAFFALLLSRLLAPEPH